MSKNQVVVAYDFSKPADVALQAAIELACRDPQTTLHFVVVMGTHQTFQNADGVRDTLVRMLLTIVRARQPSLEIDFRIHVRLGRAADEILALAEEIGADQIILGCHDRNALGRILIGSVSTAVLHAARCPVTVARLKGYAYVPVDSVAPPLRAAIS